MKKSFKIDEFLLKYPHAEEKIKTNNIDIDVLNDIYNDFVEYEISYENHADFISNIYVHNQLFIQ